MRHLKAGIKLSRTTSHRTAMFRNMVTSLFKYDRIRTTDVKAKELSRWAEHLITLAKRGDLHARRQALSIIREKDIVHHLFEQADKRFKDRNGGHIRIVKISRRPGDAALLSLVELVVSDDQEKKKGKKKPAVAKAKKTKGGPAKKIKSKGKGETKEEKSPKDTDAVKEEASSKEDSSSEKGDESAARESRPAQTEP
ncbi:MAG: 50S ribosomal protein L17 [Pseudomonadota bacterium]